MWLDFRAGQELGHHSTNNPAAFRIVFSENFVHDRHGGVR
jgi:hypothetical protein